MAELESKKASSLWPTLKKKLVEGKKRRKAKKQNPFASQGLEKFALLMAELQAKKASLMDKTGNSVSAVRYLSRSAQEWTVTTLARTASRRREKLDLSPRAAEALLLQQQQSSSPGSRVEIETVELSQSFSFPDPGHGFDSEVLQGEMNPEALQEIRDQIQEVETEEEAGCSGQTAASSARLIRSGSLFLLAKAWSQSPNSALALLVALSGCLGGRLMKLGSSISELLTINFQVRWQKGKVWADFLQLAAARHVLPHLSIRVPRGLSSLPFVRRKNAPEPEADRQSSVAEPQSEIEPFENPSFVFPVVPENSSASFPTLAALHSSDSSSSMRTSSATRRFVKRLFSKLKAKTSKSVPGSPVARKSPFSRRDKEKEMSDEDEIFTENSKKRGILKKKCSFRKDKTPEPSTTIRRSPFGKNFSMDTSTDSFHDPSSYAGQKNFDLWMVVGLLVALLFLLVSRFSAVVAMSSLFLVLSYATKESSLQRIPRRDVERQSVESARKRLMSPGCGGRLGSPSREEVSRNM